jgi:hypothetical protein
MYLYLFTCSYGLNKCLDINVKVREYRKGDQKRTIQSNWQLMVHKTKTNKTRTQYNMWLSYYVFTFGVPCCDVRYDFRINRCSVRLYLQMFVGGCMSYLRYLCVFAYSVVQHILYCVFCFVCLCLVSCVSKLQVSLDYPYLIAPF